MVLLDDARKTGAAHQPTQTYTPYLLHFHIVDVINKNIRCSLVADPNSVMECTCAPHTTQSNITHLINIYKTHKSFLSHPLYV